MKDQKVVDLDRYRRKKALIASGKRGTMTGAMPDEKIRNVRESLIRINKLMRVLEEIKKGKN